MSNGKTHDKQIFPTHDEIFINSGRNWLRHEYSTTTFIDACLWEGQLTLAEIAKQMTEAFPANYEGVDVVYRVRHHIGHLTDLKVKEGQEPHGFDLVRYEDKEKIS